MDRNSVTWAGAMPAVTTPFTSDGSLDRKGFQANIDRLIGLGATGVVACGCTGEFWSLTADERRMLYRDAVEAVGGRGTTIVGVGCVGPEDTIAFARDRKSVV